MTSHSDFVTQFFQSGHEYANKLTDEFMAEEQLFQLLENEVLKILNYSSKPDGNLIKLLLVSNILEKNNLDYLEFSVSFDSTYLEHSNEKLTVHIIRENIDQAILNNPDSPATYKDVKMFEIEEYEEKFNQSLPDEILSDSDAKELENKIHILTDESNDIYIEEVPFSDGRISHLFQQRDYIKNMFLFLSEYIADPQKVLFITALILFEAENLSSNKYVRNYYYHDIVDRVNPHKQWFACIDVQLDFLNPTVSLNTHIETKTMKKIT